MLASAYALIGRSDVAKNLIEKTTELKTDYSDYDLTFGSDLRDQAIRLMTLTLLGDGKEAALLTRDISKELSSDDWLSTQSTAFAWYPSPNTWQNTRWADRWISPIPAPERMTKSAPPRTYGRKPCWKRQGHPLP